MGFFARDGGSAPSTMPIEVVPDVIVNIDDPDDTMYALVRRNPSGWGFVVVVGFIEHDTTPEYNPDIDRAFITLAAAVRFASTAPLHSVHPECYRAPNRLLKGLF